MQERLIYAPMSAVGGLLYDRDATYVDVPDWKVQYSRQGLDVPAQLAEVRLPSGCLAALPAWGPRSRLPPVLVHAFAMLGCSWRVLTHVSVCALPT
jgi:hypothetical protein